MILKVRGLNVVKKYFVVMDKKTEIIIKRAFGERLRFLRKRLDLSQEELASICELDRTYIGGVERGERNISLLNIYKISTALNIAPAELLK